MLKERAISNQLSAVGFHDSVFPPVIQSMNADDLRY